VLLDVDHARAEGEALDISHGTAFASPMEIYAGSYDDIADAAVIIITAGIGQKPGETRIDLVNKNVEVFKGILGEIRARQCAGIILVVSNPVDILTYVTVKLSGLPESRVIGSGTVLDTGRLKHIIGEKLSVDPRNVHARILGEHGDSELAVWSGANVSGLNLDDFCRLRGQELHQPARERIYREIRDSAQQIICRKGATYYGIAMAVGRIAACIVRDEHAVLPISVVLEGEYGLDGVALSIPSIVGRNGLEKILEIPLGEEEGAALRRSAGQLREVIQGLKL